MKSSVGTDNITIFLQFCSQMNKLVKNEASEEIANNISCCQEAQTTVVVERRRCSHPMGTGSIPCSSQFPGRDFFRGFPSTVKRMSGNLGSICSRKSFGHHTHPKPSLIILGMANCSGFRCSKPYVAVVK